MRWCEVACWRGGSFAKLAGAVDAERRCLEAQAEDISVGLTGFMSQGLAAEAIRGRLGRTVEALRAEAVQVGALAAGLSGLAAAVDGVARVVGWALEMASGCGYWIDADGGVRVGEDADPGAVGQVAGLVAEALSLAAQADAGMGRVLAAGSWDVASSPVVASLTFPGDLIPPPQLPRAVRGWGDFRVLEALLDWMAETHQSGTPPSQEVLNRWQTADDPGGMTDFAPLWGLFGSQRVTQHEADMLNRLGPLDLLDFKNIKDDALAFQGGHNDVSDAMRHAYWNARLVQRFGADWTREYTTAHEGVPDPSEQLALEETMDLHNNDVGIRIATLHPDASPEELQRYVQEVARNGKLLVIDDLDPNGARLVYS